MTSEQNQTNRNFQVRALGEIAIRCRDIATMSEFYQNVIGLDYLSGRPETGIVFLKIGEGFGGHTAVLALFHSEAGMPDVHPHSPHAPITGGRSSLHHIALSLPYEEQEAVIDWYTQNNLEFQVKIFDWIGWRGIFTTDPEGNTVELVAFHQSLLQQ